MPKQLTIALVACEESADYLGGRLIQELKRIIPDASFVGVGGERMRQEGLNSYLPLEQLTAIGITEIILRLPRLWNMRRYIKSRVIKDKADIFIGIDAPDFNLGLEEQLRRFSIRTAHYVSPTIWAWRPGRIHKIKKAVELVLCLYPFEKKYYVAKNIPAIYTGHPLADSIALHNDQNKARLQLARECRIGKMTGQYIALLPGSRTSEIHYLGELFIQTALDCIKKKPSLRFLLTTTSDRHQEYLQNLLNKYQVEQRQFHIVSGKSHTVMAAADAALLASGTASLECLLIKRPMVIAYKMSIISYWIISNMIRLPYISQPNWLFNGPLVEEYIQKNASTEKLAPALLRMLDDPPSNLHQEYMKIHRRLRKNAAAQAAQAIQNLLTQK